MTKTLTYPSAEFPHFPHVAVQTPDDWLPSSVPGSVLAARAATPEGRFAPNIVVTIARYTTTFDVDDVMDLVRQGMTAHPEAKIDEPFGADFGDDRYLVVNVAFDDATAGTLVQAHAYTSVIVDETTKDVVHVMGTCAAENLATDYPLMQQVMESTRLQPVTAD